MVITSGGRGPEGYINFRGDSIAFPDLGSIWQEMEELSVKSGIWIWDIINKYGNKQIFQEFLVAGAFEFVFHSTNGYHNFGG